MQEILQQRPLQKRTKHATCEPSREAAEQRQLRRTQQEQQGERASSATGAEPYARSTEMRQRRPAARPERRRLSPGPRRNMPAWRRQIAPEPGAAACSSLENRSTPPPAKPQAGPGRNAQEARAADSALTESYITAGTQPCREIDPNNSGSTFAVLFMTRGGFLLGRNSREGRITRRWLIPRSQRHHIANQSFHFVRRKVLAVCRHISPALNDLANELVLGHPGAHVGEIRTAMTSYPLDRMTVAALHVLQNHQSLKLERRAALRPSTSQSTHCSKRPFAATRATHSQGR